EFRRVLFRSFRETYGIHIEGQLCPRCVLDLREKYGGDPYRVPVKRIFLSEQHRVGIGTFVPSDPKTQDIAELVGSMDLARIGEYGAESDPRAYRLDRKSTRLNSSHVKISYAVF